MSHVSHFSTNHSRAVKIRIDSTQEKIPGGEMEGAAPMFA
jgi:hypothetical protein